MSLDLDVWAAVRADEHGEEWVDLGTISHTREGVSVRLSGETRSLAWRRSNPVIRVQKGHLTMREVLE